jgi:hypothetical protein
LQIAEKVSSLTIFIVLAVLSGCAKPQAAESQKAVPHDIHGGTWVYENIAPQQYARRRVEVRRVVKSLAVLVRGPTVGAKVVTAGAAELFGTEFGTGK